jgi:hypothetical protein
MQDLLSLPGKFRVRVEVGLQPYSGLQNVLFGGQSALSH